MLCVPVTDDQGRAIGAIQVVNSHTGQTFTQQDIDLLTAFRSYVQITVLNRQQYLMGLTGILDVDASNIDLAFLGDRVVELVKAERGTIFILDENEDGTRFLYFIIDTPNGKKEMTIPYGAKSMAGASMIYNEIINIEDW